MMFTSHMCLLYGSTIPNLFEPHLHKGIKVCRVPIHYRDLSHEFRVVCRREGSVKSNHPELMWMTTTHFVYSELKWFKKVWCSWINPNQSTSTLHTSFPLRICSQTTQNSYEWPLHTLFSPNWVRGGSMQSNHSELEYKCSMRLGTHSDYRQ